MGLIIFINNFSGLQGWQFREEVLAWFACELEHLIGNGIWYFYESDQCLCNNENLNRKCNLIRINNCHVLNINLQNRIRNLFASIPNKLQMESWIRQKELLDVTFSFCWVRVVSIVTDMQTGNIRTAREYTNMIIVGINAIIIRLTFLINVET